MKRLGVTSKLRKAQGIERPQNIPGKSTRAKHAKILRKYYAEQLDKLFKPKS